MKFSDVLPAIRDLEVHPVGTGEPQQFLLRDPLQLSTRSVTVTQPVLFCLQFFDGRTQVATLAELWRQASDGQTLPLEHLQIVVDQLDEVFLFHNDRSRLRQQEIRREFLAAGARDTLYAGQGVDLGAVLDDCYRQAQLPLPHQIQTESDDLVLLAAPHIDYLRGGSAWALAYSRVKRHFAGEVILLLGTNHQYHEYPLALTRKNYRTLLGEVRTERVLVDELAAALPFDPFADEYCHRDEHSIELAATALRHAFGERCPAIVPVLCGSLDEFLATGTDPAANEVVGRIRTVFRDLAQREARRMMVIASVDFAHLGPQFGDPDPITDRVLDDCMAKDKALLKTIVAADAGAFIAALLAERNARHVCGASPLYYALSCAPAGETIDASLHYWRAEDDNGAVTFGVAALKRKAVTPRS